LLEDLQTAYQQLCRGEAIQLLPKSTSWKQWAQQLAAHAQSPALQQELPSWLALPRTRVSRLPVDASGANTQASAQTVSVSLSIEETQVLLQEVPAAYRSQINDVLLTALVQAFSRWTGTPSLLIDLEGHGREPVGEEADLSRTVGWFTTLFPVLLDLEGASSPGDALKRVKEQLRRLANHGIGYGLLRYLRGDMQVAANLRALPQAEVSFNYLGQFDQVLPEPSPFCLAWEPVGPTRSLRGTRTRLLEVIGLVAGGQLQWQWVYSENVHRRATIERLAEGYVEVLRMLMTHCQSPEAGGYTPSDFPLLKLDQQKLDQIIAKVRK
jgi:non-ribosomal peptide synthase protein (TIGR01720 family)